MSYRGDIRLGSTIDVKFTTRRFSTGAPFTLAGSPVISAYVGNGTTEITAGITLTVDFDARTGLNNVRVVATSGNGFATATDVELVITTGTVDSVSVVGEVVASFSIENRSALMPTTAARTLDVSAGGEAGVDWANVGSPTTTLDLSGTTVGIVTSLAANAIAASSIAANAITSAKIASGAITASGIADGAIDRATFAADTGLQSIRSNTAQAADTGEITLDASASAVTDFYKGMVVYITGGTGVGQAQTITAYNGTSKVATVNGTWPTTPDATSTFAILPLGTVFVATNGLAAASIASSAIQSTKFAAGAITATVIATGAIDADALAADAGTEIGTAVWATTTRQLTATGLDLVTAWTVNVTGNLSGSVGSVTGAVGSVTGSVGSVTGAVGSVTGSVGSIASGGISEASFATTAGTFHPLNIVDQGTAQSATSTTLVLRAAAAFADSELVGARIVITGGSAGVGQSRLITAYVSATDTATVSAWNTTPTGTITYKIFGDTAAAGGSAPTAAEVADAVWDEARSGHTTGGSYGEGINMVSTSTGAIIAGSFAANAITSTVLAANSIGSSQLAASAINSSKLANGAITAGVIADGAIDMATFAQDTGLAALITGTLDAASSSTVTFPSIASPSATTDFYKDCWVLIWSGTGSGQMRAISAYNGTTRVATVSPDFADTPSTDSLFKVIPKSALPVIFGGIRVGAFITSSITADAIAANAIGASELATDAVNEIAAAVNTEVVDALNVDTYAEPGQGTPAATLSLAAKIGYLYKAWRNRKTQTATQFKLYGDDATTVDQKATVSDDATTLDSGEIASGP